MSLPWLLCGVLALGCAALLFKLNSMQKSLGEIASQLGERLSTDTNNLIFVCSGDRHVRRLAAQLNLHLAALRRQRLQYQNGNRELKDAVTNISHDLRTPLTAIFGYLDLLRREPLTDAAARYLLLIENRTQALRQLTQELFAYSLILSTQETLTLEPVDLNSAVEESLATFYAALTARGITPTVTLTDHRIVRRLNPAALSRVLGNILNNVLKYSDGDLDVALLDSGEMLFSNSASDLTEVQVGRLFDRFFTVESARNATGLGLSIAKTLIEQMNGTITAQYADKRLWIRVFFPEQPL